MINFYVVSLSANLFAYLHYDNQILFHAHIALWWQTRYNAVQTELVYEKLDELKAAQKKKESLINLFIEDCFYEKV